MQLKSKENFLFYLKILFEVQKLKKGNPEIIILIKIAYLKFKLNNFKNTLKIKNKLEIIVPFLLYKNYKLKLSYYLLLILILKNVTINLLLNILYDFILTFKNFKINN